MVSEGDLLNFFTGKVRREAKLCSCRFANNHQPPRSLPSTNLTRDLAERKLKPSEPDFLTDDSKADSTAQSETGYETGCHKVSPRYVAQRYDMQSNLSWTELSAVSH